MQFGKLGVDDLKKDKWLITGVLGIFLGLLLILGGILVAVSEQNDLVLIEDWGDEDYTDWDGDNIPTSDFSSWYSSFTSDNPLTTPTLSPIPTSGDGGEDIEFDPLYLIVVELEQVGNDSFIFSFTFGECEHILDETALSFSVGANEIVDQAGDSYTVDCILESGKEFSGTFKWVDFPQNEWIDINIHVLFQVIYYGEFVTNAVAVFEDSSSFFIEKNNTTDPILKIGANVGYSIVGGGVVTIGLSLMLIFRKRIVASIKKKRGRK